MGNNASSTQQERIAYQSFVANYAFIRKVKDPRYGEISILEDKNTREHVALKEILSKSTTDFNREIENLKSRCQISHPNIIKLIAYTSKAEDNLCASFYKILLIIDYLEQDFEREINARRNNSDFYTEEHLWYILESVLGALVCLHKQGIAHGDLKPSNVFISKLGSYKIAEQSLLGNMMPSYALRLSGFDDVRAYLSPALIQNLSRQELYPKHDVFKSDIFTLGLSVLHAATLINCDKFYNWDDCTIDMESIQRRLETLPHRYSDQLQRFLGVMLTADESKRPSAYDLIDRIPTLDKQQQQFYLDQKPENEPRANNFEKKQMPPLLQSLENQFGFSARKEEGSGKKPIGLSRSPQNSFNAYAGEQFFRDDTRQGQVNNRLSGKAAVAKEEKKQAQVKPFEFVSSTNSLANLESERATTTATRSIPSQTNFKGNGERKESLGSPHFQAHPPQKTQVNASISQTVQPQTQSAYAQFQAVQNQPPQSRATGLQPKADSLQVGYRPSEEIHNIISQFKAQDILTPKQNEDKKITQLLQQPQQQPQPQIEKTNLTTAVSNRNSTQGQNVHQPGSTANFTSTQLLSAGLQSSQQQQNTESKVGSYYKPSPEIEKILQEIRTRNVTPANLQSNNTASNTAYANNQTPLYSSPTPINQQNNSYQPAPVLNNPNSQTTCTPSYQATTACAKQENFTATVPTGNTQTGNVPVQINPACYQPKSSDQTVKTYENFTSGGQATTVERQSNSYQSQTSFSNSNSSSFNSTFSNFGNVNQNQYAAPQDFQKTQYNQKENAYSAYSKENYSNTQYKEQYTKQSGTLNQQQSNIQQQSNTQQQTYPQNSYTHNPLQPISSNSNQHVRQNSTSVNRPNYHKTETVTEQYVDGSVYEGEKRGAFRHGKGRFYYSDGGFYDGDWKTGSMDGFGTLYYTGGQIAYEGDWKEDKFHGKGIVYNEVPILLEEPFDYTNFDYLGDYWIRYEGGFLDDNKEGFGVLYFSNGDRFEGEFLQDMVHGKGSYIFANNQAFVGQWWNNRLA